MFTIYDEATDAIYGTLDETQLQFLMDHLEEESAEIPPISISTKPLSTCSNRTEPRRSALVKLLRTALGGREDMDIRWARS